MAATIDESILPDLRPLCVPIGDVKPLTRNARRGDVPRLKASIRQFGVHRAVVAHRPSGEVLAGNHQLRAMIELGFESVPVIWTDEADLVAKARALADNRTGDLGDYDEELLASMLQAVESSPDLFAATGYESADLTKLLRRLEKDQADMTPAPIEDFAPAFGVVIECDDEATQDEIIVELRGRGLTARAMV